MVWCENVRATMRIGPAVEIAGDVLQRLAVADGAYAQHRVAAQLLDGEFEGDARAERGLFEQQAEVSAAQGLGKPSRI